MTSSDDSSDIDLAELERTWMSHELHDGLIQWVVGAKMQAESMHVRSAGGTPVSTDQLHYLVNILSKAVVEGRRLLAGLRPPDLDEADWHIALTSGRRSHELVAPLGSTLRCTTVLVKSTKRNNVAHIELFKSLSAMRFDTPMRRAFAWKQLSKTVKLTSSYETMAKVSMCLR